MATKNNPGKYDCYANAEPDEPLFVLLGRDPVAPALVWMWAVLRSLYDETGKDKEQIRDAQECAAAMMQWGVEHGKQVIGVGQAALAGTMELVKMANWAIESSKNVPTGEDFMRMLLCRTKFELPEQSPGASPEPAAATDSR